MDENLSISKCRALLGGSSDRLSDEAVVNVRAQVEELASIVVDAYTEFREAGGDQDWNSFYFNSYRNFLRFIGGDMPDEDWDDLSYIDLDDWIRE